MNRFSINKTPSDILLEVAQKMQALRKNSINQWPDFVAAAGVSAESRKTIAGVLNKL